jgi:hypothetical protein
VDYGKAGDPMYKFGKPAVLIQLTNGRHRNSSMKASSYGLKNLEYVAAHMRTSDVTNNYEDLSELYDELLSVWSRYIGHVVTNVGGVFEDIKSPIKWSCLYGCPKAQQQEAQWLQTNALLAYVVG